MTNTTKPNQYKINEDYLSPRSTYQMRKISDESTAKVIPWVTIFACLIVIATMIFLYLYVL